MTQAAEANAAGRIALSSINNAGIAALTQPLMMAGAQVDHSDYSFTDAANNILLGGLIGGAFHAGGEILGGGFSRFTRKPEAPTIENPPEADFKLNESAPTEASPLETAPTEATGLPLDRPRDAGQNQALADQMASRLGDQDLAHVSDALNPNAMSAAWDSAHEVARSIGGDENLSTEQKQEGVTALNRFISEMNDHAGSLQYQPIDSAKVITGEGGTGGDLSKFYAQLHPAVDSVSDALEMYRKLSDAKAVRQGDLPGTTPSIIGSHEAVDMTPMQDGSTARGMLRAAAASMDSSHSLHPQAAQDLVATSRPRVIADLTKQLGRAPTEPEIEATINKRSSEFMENKSKGKYDPKIEPIEPAELAHATPTEAFKAADKGDYAAAAKLEEAHVKALENDPAFKPPESALEEINQPVKTLQTIKNLLTSFAKCVADNS